MAEGGVPESSADSPSKQAMQSIFGSENLEKHLEEFIRSGRQDMTIMLSGKTGVGKSHLTNALIGQELAEEGDELDPLTMEVEPYTILRNDVRITLFDTPGLADGTGNEEEYLRKIKEKVQEFDLFLYCTQMNDTRVRKDDIDTIKKLTEAFGEHLWEHALIVLTFANEVRLPPKKDENAEDYFSKRLRSFKKKFHDVLHSQAEVPSRIVFNVLVVPTGDLSQPVLPDRENWVTAFWISAFKRVNGRAKSAFLLASIDRIRSSSDQVGTRLGRSRRSETGDCQLRRSTHLLLPEDGERHRKRMARRSFQGYEIEDRHDGENDNDDDDDDDDITRPFCRLSTAKRESIRSSRRNLKECDFDKSLEHCLSSPPPYRTLPGYAAPIVLDEPSTAEFAKEVLGSFGIGKAGLLIGDALPCGFGGIFGRLANWIIQFVKKLFEKSIENKAAEKEAQEHDDRAREKKEKVSIEETDDECQVFESEEEDQ